MSSDSRSPLATIQAILERHRAALPPALSTGFSESSVPAFDPRALHSQVPPPQANIAQRVSSWGLPESLSAEITTFLFNESTKYQALVERTRGELLGQLIKTSVSPNPSVIPSLVESTCAAVYQSTIDSVLLEVQRQIETFNLNDAPGSDGDAFESDDDLGSASASDDDNDAEDDDEFDERDQEHDEDNSPMRPGEEVPPLETKYLPIFEALHERGKVLTKPEKTYLVNMTGMTYRQITIWFQNRRRGELKEDQARAFSSHAASVPSDEASESSDDELDLEKRLTNFESDATFNIRSWCLASAAATKSDAPFASLPTSPTKLGFGPVESIPELDSDDSDLSDTDDEVDVPPGLRVPSLATSVTTLDSGSDRGPLTIASGSASNVFGSSGPIGNVTGVPTVSRPIKPLPSSRRDSPPAPSLPVSQTNQTLSFDLNFTDTSSQTRPLGNTSSIHIAQPQFVSFNERGPSAESDTTPPASTVTPQSSPSSSTAAISRMPASSTTPSPPGVPSWGSQRNTSPTPSSHSASSPRPPTKPLPRRTGCAPRPRPPPRAGSTSAPVLTAPSSARPSIILPPSSNPSLTNTTLGALLRPNPPGPVIPLEMEERLSAMAGRMGVGASSGPDSVKRNAPAGVPSARSSIAQGVNASSSRGTSFSFGPATLPTLNASPESVPQSNSGARPA